MRVLQINATYGVGSTGKIVRDISDELILQGHQSFVMWATSCKKDDSDVKLIRIGNTFDHKLHAVAWRIDKKQAWHSKLATKKACRKIKGLNPDVVHLHNLHNNYIHLPTLLSFLRDNNIATLVTLHDCWFFTGGCAYYKNHACLNWQNRCASCPIYKKAALKMYSEKKQLFSQMKSLAINGVSKWTAADAQNSILGKATIIKHIYNWIDTELFKPQSCKEKIKEMYKIPHHHKLILGVSQGWSKRKGLEEFIYIAKGLSDIATVVLVGGSEYQPDAKNLLCIGYTSNVQQLIELYSAADVFVNPSNAETFGLVTAEALSCGTPVVAYDNSGTSEIVTEKCGVLVEDGNMNALLNAVKTILTQKKEVYSLQCRERVCNHFEKNSQIQKYIELYNDMLNKKSHKVYDNKKQINQES